VKIFRNGDLHTVLADFFGIDDPNFRGGARVGVGDMNGDLKADVIVSAGFLGGPRVAGFDAQSILSGNPTRLFNDFFAFEDTLRNGTLEALAVWLQDGVGGINNLASTLTAFWLGLGAFSLLRIHGGKVFKQQKDWAYSLVLLISMAVMVFVGYWAWWTEKFSPLAVGANKVDLNLRENWNTAIYARDFVFDGMLQKMDAAMFSVIAFYIISAAYRAFRIRSVEATILLCAALIMMLSLLAVVDVASNGFGD